MDEPYPLKLESLAAWFCWLNVGILVVMGVLLASERWKTPERSAFVVPLPPPREGNADFRRLLSLTGFGLLLFALGYALRATYPFDKALNVNHWQSLLTAPMVIGLIKATGEADAKGVRVSRHLPAASDTHPFIRTQGVHRWIYRRYRLLRWPFWLALMLDVVVALWMAWHSVPPNDVRLTLQSFIDSVLNFVSMAVVALTLAVELNRFKAGRFGRLVTVGCVVLTLCQVVPFIFQIFKPENVLTSWPYWFNVLAAFIAKCFLGLGLLGLGGIARFLEGQIDTANLVAAGQLGHLLAHQTKHVGGSMRLRLGLIERLLPQVPEPPRGALEQRITGMRGDLRLLSLAVEAYRELGGDLARPSACDVDATLSSVCDLLREEWTDVELIFVPPGAGRAKISEAALVIIAFNVLDNARNAMRASGTEAPQILITAERADATERADGFVRVRVSDNGPGVPREQRAKLFKFPQPGQEQGMGLWICRKLAERMEGRIWEERVDRGASFVMECRSE